MANFWDLPEVVRKKIYRLHLLQNKPITYDEYKKFCRCTRSDDELVVKAKRNFEIKLMPSLLQADLKVEREASQIYFGENTFVLFIPRDIGLWVKHLSSRHLNLIQSINLASWINVLTPWYIIPHGLRYDADFARLGRLKSLERLTVTVDENDVLHALINKCQTIRWHSSLAYGPQINLKVMHANGMAGFRSIRGLRYLEFLRTDLISTGSARGLMQTGSIDGGYLETVLRHEVMQSRTNEIYVRTRHFRFLDLPADVRNIIYGLLLTFPGPTYPTDELPTSVTSQYEYMRLGKRDAIPVPHSALGLLCTNQQIYREAKNIFYLENDLVFSIREHLDHFLFSLTNLRLGGLQSGRSDALRSVTLFYVHHSETEQDFKMRSIFYKLGRLPGLRKFHLLCESKKFGRYQSPLFLPPAKLPGASQLFELRNLDDIVCRDLPAEDWYRLHPVRSTKNPRPVLTARWVDAYRHFSHGLQMAQHGTVHRELYNLKDWYGDNLWPVLDGSDCGFSKGCTCGQSEDGPD